MKRFSWIFILLFVMIFALAACGGGEQAPAEEAPAEEPMEEAPTEEPMEEPTEEPMEEPEAELTGSVGIVLPTRDEPRWIQDETRFRDALEAEGYDVEILFSQGDSGIERTNVEQLITQ
ncbi:MAG: hypothetical protein R3293_20345, partial [Candidatus Promineifilaceae bacterium]|nr:hypothetical protein [Candidatus Promineifilaceae bacterium]